jgi:hypothetical protein
MPYGRPASRASILTPRGPLSAVPVDTSYAARYGLVEYFSLDNDGSGGVSLVGSHNGNVLTNTGAAPLGTGKIGGAVQLNGTNQHLSLADSAAFSTGDVDHWLSAWFLADVLTAATFPNIAGKSSSTIGSHEYALQATASTGTLSFFTGGSAQKTATTTATFTAGGYHFGMGYYDAVGDLVGVSLDGGAFVTAATAGVAPPDSSSAFRIGGRGPTPDRLWPGRIDSVCFGKAPALGIAALATEIRDYLWNAGAGRPYTDLLVSP